MTMLVGWQLLNDKSKLRQIWGKYQLYRNLLLETDFGVKFYVEAAYWKKLDSDKNISKILLSKP